MFLLELGNVLKNFSPPISHYRVYKVLTATFILVLVVLSTEATTEGKLNA